MFAELDEDGAPVVCQFLQTGAMFAEGLCAVQEGGHLLTIWNMLITYVETLLEGKHGSLLTMTRDDKQGARIGRAVGRMKFKDAGVKVYRREF